MAKVKNQEKHGSVGPSTFQSSPYGTIERQRGQQVDPNTPAQQHLRGIMKGVSSQWRTLTDEQRDGWRALAAQRPGHLHGGMLYNQVNAVLVACGLPQRQTAPFVPAFGRLTCAGLVVDDTPRVQLKQVSVTASVDRLIVEACTPLHQGISYFKNRFRYVTVADAPADAPADLDVTAAYIAVFSAPQAGQRVVVRITAMKNGFKDAALQLSAIVADTKAK